MFSNSPTIGDWETFIADDLTAIDAATARSHRARPRTGRTFDGRLRDDANRDEAAGRVRGDVCDEFVLPDERGRRPWRRAGPRGCGRTRGGAGRARRRARQRVVGAGGGLGAQRETPPDFFDLPTQDGETQPLIAANGSPIRRW